MEVLNLDMSAEPSRLSVRMIVPYGLSGGPTSMTVFQEFFAFAISEPHQNTGGISMTIQSKIS
jgi:hypothetical protein